MTGKSPPPALDLLIVGGMTIDRFADGSAASGGSVIHASRAAAARGSRVGVVTAAGPEPMADRGLATLRARCALVDVARHAATTTFMHREGATGRRLWLDRIGGSIALVEHDRARIAARAVLYAPIASEVDSAALNVWDRSMPRAGILQGWLRTTAEGAEVTPLPLSDLDPAVVTALAGFELLVASREDLVAEAETPEAQLTALRRVFGRQPALIVTNATDGLWLDVDGSREYLPVPSVVDDAPTVGAGDILAAFLVVPHVDPAATWSERATTAMRAVAEDLAARQRP